MNNEELLKEYTRSIVEYFKDKGTYGRVVELQNQILDRMNGVATYADRVDTLERIVDSAISANRRELARQQFRTRS